MAVGNSDTDTHSLQHQLAILDSPDLDAVYELALDLRENPNPALLDALINRLNMRKDPDWLRKVLIQTLGITLSVYHLSSNKARALLLQELQRSDAYESRKSAAIALGILDEAEAVTPLIRILENGEEDMVFASMLALGELGSAQAVDILLKYLRSEEPLTRQAAADALGMIGASAKHAVPALRQLAEFGTERDKRCALAALSAIERAPRDRQSPI